MNESNPTKKAKYVDKFIYCEYNENISKKFYKFLELGLTLSFEVQNEDNCIILSINLSDYDKSVNSLNGSLNGNNMFSSSNKYNEDYITFFISKTNFKITKNHMDVCGYKDPYIYELFNTKIKEFYEKRSSELFHKTINEILDVIPSIGREYKIDEIFTD